MTRRFSVVLSGSQSLHPDRQAQEERLATLLAQDGRCDVLLVPHLYDLDAAGPSVAALRELSGDLIVLAWLYPRAAHWILDRHGVRGRQGRTSLDGDAVADAGEAAASGGVGLLATDRILPDRTIYCLDLRRHEGPQPYLEAIQQILRVGAELRAASAAESTAVPLIPSASGTGAQVHPVADAPGPPAGPEEIHPVADAPGSPAGSEKSSRLPAVRRIEEPVRRRWYPVIDFSRCTNCMECIDFCLFGVYGVDQADRILVELPDNCRKGCPACSRVCPENAILFPQHKTPAIAGGMREPGGLKLDLSALFGAAESLLHGPEIAARERDEHLLLAGQRPAGPVEAVPEPQANDAAKHGDELDALIDQLDALDL